VSDKNIIQITNLTKIYGDGVLIKALDNINLTIERGEFMAIVGPSGSGKSTLLNMIGILDTPTHGTIILDGVDITQASEKKPQTKTTIRRRKPTSCNRTSTRKQPRHRHRRRTHRQPRLQNKREDLRTATQTQQRTQPNIHTRNTRRTNGRKNRANHKTRRRQLLWIA